MENSIINKRKVIISTFFIPLAVPITGLFFGMMDNSEDFLGVFLMFATLGLIYGAIFWIPSILACIMIESVAIQPKTSSRTVLFILIGEAVAAFLIISGVFDMGFRNEQFIWILALAIACTQGIRILYLYTKNRIYNEPPTEDQVEIIDDLN